MTSEGTMVPRIRLTSGKAKRTLVELRGKVTLGRLGSVEVPLSDSKASREHARIFEQAGDWHVVDLNSTNGTLVNGAKITRRSLRPGDEITIGTTSFVFEMPEPPKPAAPSPPPEPAVQVRTAAPAAAAPAESLGMDDIVVKQRSLQFHRIEGKRQVNPLLQDVGQRSGLFKLVLYAGLLLVAVALFFVASALVRSMVGSDEETEDEAVYEETE